MVVTGKEPSMNENELLALTVEGHLEAGTPLVLVSIMGLEGSTPRHSGTKMVVAGDGGTRGTIGGGLIEAAAIRASREVLAGARPRILPFDLTGRDAAAPGMICGGRAELLLDYLAPSEENREFARRWREAVGRGGDFYLLTRLEGEGESLRVLGRAVLLSDGDFAGGTAFTASDIGSLRPELHNVSTTSVLALGGTRVMVDRIRRLKTVYCLGAGHVAVPTARLASLAGFRVVVVDDRPDYASAERFPEASQIIVAGFERAFDGLEIDGDSFIVIVTRGHRYDRAVLEQALRTPAGYIGMIGSRTKRDAIYTALADAGVKKERLEQVHSPIGVDIGAETPEEIAVSIVAEMIKVRNRPSS
jgi:xanthine dehydrogenase accessory factor